MSKHVALTYILLHIKINVVLLTGVLCLYGCLYYCINGAQTSNWNIRFNHHESFKRHIIRTFIIQLHKSCATTR